MLNETLAEYAARGLTPPDSIKHASPAHARAQPRDLAGFVALATGEELHPWQQRILAELKEAHALGQITPNAARWAHATMRPRGKSLMAAADRLRRAASVEADGVAVGRDDLCAILDEFEQLTAFGREEA
jgi:hypothetical protein